MTGVAEYVGAEPEGLRYLASALDAAKGELRFTNDRIQALLAEAGDGDVTCGALSSMAFEVSVASADIRTRAAVADDLITLSKTPVCVVPWYDPLRRAAAAVKSNVWNAGAGAVDGATAAGTTVWRLTPINGEWRQEWVDLRAGLQAAKENPRAAVDAAAGMPQLEERGYAYWLGGIGPDFIASALGGAGVAKRVTTTADVAGDVADLGEDAADIGGVAAEAARLGPLARLAMSRTNSVIMPGDRPQGPLFGRPWPDPEVEPVAKARVLAIDKETGGHSARRHGPETTLEQQQVRAETGRTPDGLQRTAWDASRFFRWQDLNAAIEDARARWTPGRLEIKVPFDHLVGEGYRAGGVEYVQTKVALVKFNTHGQPYTAFPYLRATP